MQYYLLQVENYFGPKALRFNFFFCECKICSVACAPVESATIGRTRFYSMLLDHAALIPLVSRICLANELKLGFVCYNHLFKIFF